jgi:hypothetical protein
MDHIFSRKPERWCYPCFAGWAATNQAAGFEQFAPGSFVNRSIHTASSQQPGIGSVYNDITRKFCNVCLFNLYKVIRHCLAKLF